LREENKFEFETSNVLQYHKSRYKGKKVKIAVFENSDKEHMQNVIRTIKEYLPEATMYTWQGDLLSTRNDCQHFREFSKFCIENGVHLITSSYSYTYNIHRYNAWRECLDNGIIINQSAGNENKEIPDNQLRYYMPEINIISAILEYSGGKKPRIERASYSNKGKLLDYADFTNIFNERTKFTGTSCSTPSFTAKEGIMIDYLIENGYDWHIVTDIVDDNLLDLGTTGKDDLYGKGLFILPDLDNFKWESEDMKFKDVEETRWSAKAIEYVTDKGYFKGFDDDRDGDIDTFKPSNPLTREELAQVLYNYDLKKN
jgi:hypothetical protein